MDEKLKKRTKMIDKLFETIREETDPWATYKIGEPKQGGTIIYGPLSKAIVIAKRDKLPWVKDMSNKDEIVWTED